VCHIPSSYGLVDGDAWVTVTVTCVGGSIEELGDGSDVVELEAVGADDVDEAAFDCIDEVTVVATTSVVADGEGVCRIVVAEVDEIVTTMVVGVSDSVTTTVDNCVTSEVRVAVTASVTVVVRVSWVELLPSTATTEYETGCRRSIRLSG